MVVVFWPYAPAVWIFPPDGVLFLLSLLRLPPSLPLLLLFLLFSGCRKYRTLLNLLAFFAELFLGLVLLLDAPEVDPVEVAEVAGVPGVVGLDVVVGVVGGVTTGCCCWPACCGASVSGGGGGGFSGKFVTSALFQIDGAFVGSGDGSTVVVDVVVVCN